MGWSDRAAICLAVEKTGPVISAAGVIMIVSFGGLLLPKTIVLNQYGFSLAFGVAIDTFLIRPLVCPALLTVLGDFPYVQLNWWPSKMPTPVLTAEEEIAAILRGETVPPVPQPKSVEDADDGRGPNGPPAALQ